MMIKSVAAQAKAAGRSDQLVVSVGGAHEAREEAPERHRQDAVAPFADADARRHLVRLRQGLHRHSDPAELETVHAGHADQHQAEEQVVVVGAVG